jgi:hypothetical protein
MISIHAKKMDYIKGGSGKSEFVTASHSKFIPQFAKYSYSGTSKPLTRQKLFIARN